MIDRRTAAVLAAIALVAIGLAAQRRADLADRRAAARHRAGAFLLSLGGATHG